VFSTNAQGQITSWAIGVQGGGGGNVSGGNGIMGIGLTSSQAGDAMSFEMILTADYYTGSVVSIAAASAGAGAWYTDPGGQTVQVSVIRAPEIDGRGAVSGLTLLAGLLLVIKARRST
jgi:hypothetical protein